MSTDDDKKVFPFPGDKIDTAWDGRLCIHIGECTRAKGELFQSGRDPWGQPDRGEADYVAEVVRRCPTGALTYRRKDGGADETPASENTVTVANNGPLYVQGDLDVDGAGDDMPGVRFRAALCRCGDSKNKPFCDNTHEGAGFRDRGALGETGDANAPTGGKLEIRRAPNGPLLLSGNFSMITGSGRVAWRGTKGALCRCGASNNKPFCDGRHKDVGFEVE
jgi:CDGSH-type Zn-finger protein/uncharacterized Fe-S cluster protein YjdI